MPDERIEFAAVTAERWPDLVQLFEARGGPHHCFCTAWRRLPSGSDRRDSDVKRATLERTVQAGTPVGLLVYLDGEPAGWCSVAPRETFRDLGGNEYGDGTSVWSVVCFFVPRARRGQGLAAQLLGAACDEALAAGADVIEGYPVDPDSPSYRFMGVRSMFLDAGFEETGMAGSRRHVMRRRLR